MTTEEIIKQAAEPHLIASSRKANELLSFLNGLISDLRLEVNELELKSDFHFNQLMSQMGKTVDQKKAEHKISEPYREFKNKKGTLQDLRAIRRNLERHADMLMQQERYQPKHDNPHYSI